jgi:hypothetical protein
MALASRSLCTLLVLTGFSVFSVLPALAQDAEQSKPTRPVTADDLGHHWLASTELAAELTVGNARERVTGRASLYLVASHKLMQQGYVTVHGFNILFTGVSQKLLAPAVDEKKPLGMLGFAVTAGKPQQLKYNPRTGRVAGELRMFADASFLAAYARPAEDGKGDLFLTPTIPVTATVDLTLEKPISLQIIEVQQMSATLDVKLDSGEFTYERLKVPPLRLRLLERIPIRLDIFPDRWFEVAQSLCVQPVNILRSFWDGWWWFGTIVYQWSGTGLAFGEPGARTQWAKADVVLDIRPWKTVYSNDYWVVDSGDANGLRAKVDDDDCVEVFFPNDFDPPSMWGGGATWGSGTASAQVISSDGNARGGVDFTHLAHELGHVLGLLHPGSAATASAVAASTGTLLCPSGYLNDNPQINSQENKNLLSNPLLTFAIKFVTPGPDCVDSAGCGACP